MKNLPTFIQNYLTDSSLTKGQTKKALSLISATNQLPNYSDEIDWFIGKEQLTAKPAFYSLPVISGKKLLSWAGKKYNEKSEKNHWFMVVRSDKGIFAPLHMAKESKAFFHLNDFEKLLLSFEGYENPKIYFNESMDEFFGSVTHNSGNFEILLTGSFNEKFSANLFIRNKLGLITKVGRSNRHTLNFELKQVEQLETLEEEFEVSEKSIVRFMEKLETFEGTFDQLYSWIFLGGKSVEAIPSKSKAKYNKMKNLGTNKVSNLRGFFLICCEYDNILINDNPHGVLVNTQAKNYIAVAKYAKLKIDQIGKLPAIR